MSQSQTSLNELPLEEQYIGRTDPLHLTGFRKDPKQLDQIKKSGKRGRKISQFYKNQNALIDTLLEPTDYRDPDDTLNLTKLKIAIYGSVAANTGLFGLQLYAAVASGSIALFATTADAFMDLASSLVLLFTGRAASTTNGHEFPAGKKRLETSGIIVCATLMATLSLQLMVEAVKTLLAGDHSVSLTPLSIAAVATALAIKGLLYLYCAALSQYPTAAILAQDHRNDVIFNSSGIVLSLLGQHVRWWLDPAGGLIIALFIMKSWSSTAYEHIQQIVGKSAPPAVLQRIAYISFHHDPRVLQIDTCRAYYSGSHFIVEVDLVLPPEMPLQEAHDIGEALQVKLEGLANVERAFVHLDYESSHAPEHRKER